VTAGPGRVASRLLALLCSADPTGTGVAIGAGTIILGVLGYLFKELRRKDDSVWRLMAEKDAENVRLRRERDAAVARAARVAVERDFWRTRRLAESDTAYQELDRLLEGHDRGDDEGGEG
jgi:hypothetical protein